MRIIMAILLLVALTVATIAPARAYVPPQNGQEDRACEWCQYIPQWCWACFAYHWWENGGDWPWGW